MRRALAGAAGLAALVPPSAEAHSFAPGRTAADAFIEGAVVVLAGPGLLLLAALAIALALWEPEGLGRAWLHFLVATIAGLFIAPAVVSWVGVAALGLGLLVAVLATLVQLARIGGLLPWLGALLGLALTATVLEGHPVGTIPYATLAGILITANATLATLAGLVLISLENMPYAWVTVAWRVAASWIAAILLLYLAFVLRF